MNPKISIVIPVYNSAKYLRECLDSICRQSFTEWEVVAVDDGSSDESPKILDEYAAADARIRVVHKANGGVSAARNDGLDAAVGEYVLFVDSDDWLDDEALEVMIGASENSDADMVVADHFTWREKNGTETPQHFFEKEFEANSRKDLIRLQQMTLYQGYAPYASDCCDTLFPAPWAKLIKKNLLDKFNIRFNTKLKLYEDGLFILNLLQHAEKVRCIRNVVYHYRIVSSSLCHKDDIQLANDYAAIAKEVEEFLALYDEEKFLRNPFYARMLYVTKKMVLHSYFYKNARDSFFVRYRKFANLLRQSPYKEALQNFCELKLLGRDRQYGKLLHCHLSFVVGLLYELRARFL
ncbi:glycosyltransferase family 2 protein [Fibrobacter sp.]|uniref:glycosyltransferase family 2 protein n=1 Tax=Fibrobacter sp. TaxID=35828 RepID=UPI00389019FA